jgi:hypothetical protein
MVFLSTSTKARNEAFNVTNGDLFRWKHLWPRVARLFDMPCGEVQTLSLSQWMADKDPIWDRIGSGTDILGTNTHVRCLFDHGEIRRRCFIGWYWPAPF